MNESEGSLFKPHFSVQTHLYQAQGPDLVTTSLVTLRLNGLNGLKSD